MNASEIRADSEWDWTSYKRLGWVNKQGQRLYEAHLRSDGPRGFTTCTIRFWARRPILALRSIVNSGNDPLEFHQKEIN